MEQSFKSVIDNSSSLLILLPKNPYFDQVAAGLSLYLTLRQENKDASIISPSPMLVEHNRLVGIDKITSEVGNKNLIMSFSDYDASGIEKVSYDIEGAEFKLTVIPKPQTTPPAKDQVVISYAGVLADTVVLIGGGNESHFPSLQSADLASVKLVHVGVHDLTIQGRDLISFAKPASSISELVGNLLKEVVGESGFDSDVASNLLMGMYQGSRNFAGTNVTADTFAVAADLMKSGGKSQKAVEPKIERKSFPPGAIPGQMPQTENKFEVEKPSEEKPEQLDAPKSWLQPKIYKGTSVS